MSVREEFCLDGADYNGKPDIRGKYVMCNMRSDYYSFLFLSHFYHFIYSLRQENSTENNY